MKFLILILLLLSASGHVMASTVAPNLEPLSQEEIGQWVGKVRSEADIDKAIIRRGLISGQTALRADCARYLASKGDLSDIPYLIDALLDESVHVGVTYIFSGMMTTRYWANVALISITNIDLGYRWDDPIEERSAAVRRWTNHWISIRHRVEG